MGRRFLNMLPYQKCWVVCLYTQRNLNSSGKAFCNVWEWVYGNLWSFFQKHISEVLGEKAALWKEVEHPILRGHNQTESQVAELRIGLKLNVQKWTTESKLIIKT